MGGGYFVTCEECGRINLYGAQCLHGHDPYYDDREDT